MDADDPDDTDRGGGADNRYASSVPADNAEQSITGHDAVDLGCVKILCCRVCDNDVVLG